MACKLCLKDKELIRKSHIIPDFMYDGLYDEKHRFHEVTVTKDKDIKTEGFRQTGGYEGQILCQSCDNEVLGKLEKYASQVLYGGIPNKIQKRDKDKGMEYTLYEKIDHRKFKLFLLSLLWRASISKLPIFKDINLGRHEEKIRQMIIDNILDDPVQYQCAMASYLHLEEAKEYQFIRPGSIEDDDGFVFLFSIGGILYFYYESHVNSLAWLDTYAFKANGELKLIHMTNKVVAAVFRNFVGMDLMGN